jgi:NAD(P)H-dependent FMN reductase
MKIELIIGSTRPGRVGPQIAQWVVDNLPNKSGVEYEIIDIKDWNLPLMDETNHPAANQYEHEHTKVWGKKISEASAYIFLTPEYNAGYSASLKNAIDYLYHEWQNKPTMIISYGIHGGTGAAGQLKQVAERLKMRLTEISPAFSVNKDMADDKGQIKDISSVFKPYKEDLEQAAEQLFSLADDTIDA